MTHQQPSERAVLDAAMDEETWMGQVVTAARLLGWMVYHTYDSRRSEPGFPDLVLCHPEKRKTLCVELKRQDGKLTQAQDAWLRVLEASGVRCAVWRPGDWPTVEKVLTESEA